MSISKKAFKFEGTDFLSNLTDGIDHLIQKIIFVLPRLFKEAQI